MKTTSNKEEEKYSISELNKKKVNYLSLPEVPDLKLRKSTKMMNLNIHSEEKISQSYLENTPI